MILIKLENRNGRRRFHAQIWKLAVTIEFPSPAKAG
jgi:hypothetical protein